MMAEFVSIPTQRLKARQFKHPDDDSEATVKTYSSVEVASVFGRNRAFFGSDGDDEKLKRDDSRKQLLKYQLGNVTAVKDPKEEQEMSDWLKNLQLKSQSTSSVLLTSTAAQASIITAAAFRLKSKIKNKNSNGLIKSISTPIITIDETLTEPQEKVAEEQVQVNDRQSNAYLHTAPLIPKTKTIVKTDDKSSISRSKHFFEVDTESQLGSQHSAETPLSDFICNQPAQLKTVGSKIKKSKKSMKREFN